MKRFVSRWLFLIVVLASFGAFLLARLTDGNMELTVFLSTITVLVIGIALERMFPYSIHWNKSKGDFKNDVVSTVVLFGVVVPFIKYIAPICVITLYGLMPPGTTLEIFPTDLNFTAQLVIALLLIELGRYWVHRWHHSVLPSEANKNYGGALVIWDIVFGTFMYQKNENSPKRIGLFSQNGYYPDKANYFSQVFSVCCFRCCK